jgi:hypothetical protein
MQRSHQREPFGGKDFRNNLHRHIGGIAAAR